MVNKLIELLELCKSKDININKYIEILQEMEPLLPPIKKREENIFGQLIESWNLESKMLDNIESDISKLHFWEKEVYHRVWCKIRDDSLGHLFEFNVGKHYIKMRIRIDFCVRKKDEETKEEYKKRKEEIFNACPYELEYQPTINAYRIKDTENNKKMYLEYLHSFIDFDNYEINIKSGCIYDIFIYAHDIHVEDNENTPELKWGLATIENIGKELSEVIDSIQISKCIPNLNDTCNSIISSSYYYICEKCDYENDYTREYENVVISDREKNRIRKEKAKKIGVTYSVPKMLDCVKEIDAVLSKYLARKYCIYIDDIYYHDCLVLSMKVSKDLCSLIVEDLNNIDNSDFAFSNFSYWNEDTYDYLVYANHIKEISDILYEDVQLERFESEIKEVDEVLIIKQLSGIICDYMSVLHKIKERE